MVDFVMKRGLPGVNFWKDVEPFLEAVYYNRRRFTRKISESIDIKELDAKELWFWSQTATFRHFDVNEPVYMPGDLWDELERKYAHVVQKERGYPIWGMELGVRYFASREHLPPQPLKDKQLMSDLGNYVEQIGLSKSMILEIALLGTKGEELLKGFDWLKRHWITVNHGENRVFYRNEEQPTLHQAVFDLVENHPEIYARFQDLAKKMVEFDANIARRTKRTMRWKLLRLMREEKLYQSTSKFSFFSLIWKVLYDLSKIKVK